MKNLKGNYVDQIIADYPETSGDEILNDLKNRRIKDEAHTALWYFVSENWYKIPGELRDQIFDNILTYPYIERDTLADIITSLDRSIKIYPAIGAEIDDEDALYYLENDPTPGMVAFILQHPAISDEVKGLYQLAS